MTLPASFASFRHLAVRRKMSKSEVSGISKVAVVGDGAAGVRARDPLTFAAVTVAVGATSLLALYSSAAGHERRSYSCRAIHVS